MKKRVYTMISLILAASLLGGCETKENADEQQIELIDPVGVSADYVLAEYRDLVAYKVLPGKVVPKTTEVSFSTDQRFEKYGALPGTEVSEETPVMYASTKQIDEQIKLKKEEMDLALEDYSYFLKETKEKIAIAKSDMERYEDICHNFEVMTEDEQKAYGGLGYEKEYDIYKGKCQSAIVRYEKLTQDMKEKSELYDLDSDYNRQKLARLNTKRNNVLALAGTSGTVVAINFYDSDTYIERNVPVAAIGDFNQLEVKTDWIYKSEVKRADDAYALVNGVRYEIQYKDLNLEEEENASNQEQKYSTFILDDPQKTVKAGDFAAIVIVSNRKENVLCVPKSSVSTDQDGAFVYTYDGENTYRTPIKTGLSSGLYTEVVSGLEAGDKIICELKNDKNGTKTDTVKKGLIGATFKENGYLFYSKTDWITNPVEYGTTYIDEIIVKKYERVEQGQVIARVHVAQDSINLRRTQRTLLRATEDLNEMLKDNKGKEETRAIKNQRDYIDRLNEKISKMQRDAALVELKAPYNGIITAVYNYEEGDILFKEAKVVQISAEENCFVAVEDKNGQLTCGNTANIKYEAGGQKLEAVGTVVTVAPCALTTGITTGYALIQVSTEDLEKMSASNQGNDGWWMRSHFAVTVDTRSMDNVVLVPKGAVYMENGITYVTVLDENNNPVYKSFVAGGSDSTYYWVAEGLSEGTKICLE
ncbi:MAG: hypothetical protein MJ107_02145 [Lachnospiraceae bacterium]|nr:hypothetical protein [Lachnospiraceae bacterium]